MEFHLVRFPCAVYKRASQRETKYKFSHTCIHWTHKRFPVSLHTHNLRKHSNVQNRRLAQKSVFLVLVTDGHLAEGVSLETIGKKRQKFLYSGSQFEQKSEGGVCEDIDHKYVDMCFYSTLTNYRYALVMLLSHPGIC